MQKLTWRRQWKNNDYRRKSDKMKVGLNMFAKREGRTRHNGYQQLQYGVAWQMGVASQATQRGVMG